MMVSRSDSSTQGEGLRVLGEKSVGQGSQGKCWVSHQKSLCNDMGNIPWRYSMPPRWCPLHSVFADAGKTQDLESIRVAHDVLLTEAGLACSLPSAL